MSDHSAQWIFSTSFTRSNLDIFRLFLKHWIQLNQSYNYASQSMLSSQRAYVDSGGRRDTTRWASQSAQWIFPTSITRSNLDIFQLFWKHWIQLIQNYNYVFQSMWDSQRAEINSSEKRCWQLRDRAVSTLNILDLICWVKSSYFPEIFESLNWSRSTLQSSSAKVFHQRASSRSSRLMID